MELERGWDGTGTGLGLIRDMEHGTWNGTWNWDRTGTETVLG